LGQTFFGLTSEYRVKLHQNIFSLVYYGNGGFTYQDVYAMPVYLRIFYMKQLEETKRAETELLESAKSQRRSTKR
jgi:hypothetical protein